MLNTWRLESPTETPVSGDASVSVTVLPDSEAAVTLTFEVVNGERPQPPFQLPKSFGLFDVGSKNCWPRGPAWFGVTARLPRSAGWTISSSGVGSFAAPPGPRRAPGG